MIYKPELAKRIHSLLSDSLGEMDMVMTCCRRDPGYNSPTQVINICPGCDKRFRSDYVNCSTISLWEILAVSDSFPFPDYGGQKMTIVDACPTRDQDHVQKAIREIVKKMNIDLVEPEKTMAKSTCCGDSFFGVLPVEEVKYQMVKKASEMPLNDVVVYCVSCSKSMFIGNKQPRYLIDLLFNETTVPKTYEPDEWHSELSLYIEAH